MDKMKDYKDKIKSHLRIIEDLCNRRPTPGVETLCVFDDEREIYLLVSTGWTKDRRIRGITLFLRLRNGKIWIEEDWTEYGIANDLFKAGVPKEDIVLAFHSPETRQHPEFALA